MSAPLINRSLTTIRTELEFLHDSEVITEDLFKKLLESLPTKYQKDMQPWGLDKLGVAPSIDLISSGLKDTKISGPPPSYAPPVEAPPTSSPAARKPLAYSTAIYDYLAQEADDLSFHKGDRLAVVEHLSEDWWKGYHKNTPSKVGVFPSNYVNVISESEFNDSSINEKSSNEKSSYRPPSQPPVQELAQQQYHAPEHAPSQPQPYSYPLYNLYQQPPANYGSPAPFPPPSTNYYPQQQQPQQVQQVPEQNSGSHPHLRKFGGKLGNAAIFGAGATIGSDIVNSIF